MFCQFGEAYNINLFKCLNCYNGLNFSKKIDSRKIRKYKKEIRKYDESYNNLIEATLIRLKKEEVEKRIGMFEDWFYEIEKSGQFQR